jgi:hypothetical protein
MRASACILLALGLTIGSGGRLCAQTPSPAAEAASANGPDFSGTWTLDRRLSDDPAQTNFEAPPAGQNQASNRRRGSIGGFGGRASFGGSAGSGNRNDSNATLTPDERARLVALTTELKIASGTLTIAHHDPAFVVTDAQGTALSFETNAARRDQTLGAAALTSTTHWQDGRIITEFAIGARRTLVYTYTLLPKTHQLVLRVRPQFSDLTGGSGGNAPELKLVYVPKS